MGQQAPPITAADIFTSANTLFKKHGRDAVTVALMRAEQSLSQGDMNAYRTWKRIIMVVDELSALAPETDFTAH